MPHECTTCGRTFSDGSKEMLSGCPDCGGNKFQFRPRDAAGSPEPEPAAAADPARAESEGGRAASTPSSDRGMQFESSSRPETKGVGSGDVASEDGAQAEARSDMVDRTELPDRPARDPGQEETEETNSGLEQLREELNEQFESIKIVEPGQYELNLMSLYDREEYIIALRENGRYVINVPDSWQD